MRGKVSVQRQHGPTRHTLHEAYGVLIVIAFTADTMAERRAATENNFIAALYEEGWKRGGNKNSASGLLSHIT